jgi:hypothetical protein
MMTSRTKLTLFASAILLAGSAGSARADYTFNFNTLTPSPTQSDQSTAIANYMDLILGCPTGAAGCVQVSGLDASGSPTVGVAVAQKYTGDGHVVGPVVSGTPVSVTLGNTDGATNNSGPVNGTYDSYISNTADPTSTNGPVELSHGIQITFSAGHSLTGSLSFDFQIFPDGSCGGSACATDLTFSADGSTPYSHTWNGVAPLTMTNGTSTHSPNSLASGTELSPQLIGTTTNTVGTINLTNATTLKFMDWPETIGIDNLKLTTTATPEPMGQVFLLAGLGLVGLAGKRLRRALSKSSPEA